jgi:hypothetical protein
MEAFGLAGALDVIFAWIKQTAGHLAAYPQRVNEILLTEWCKSATETLPFRRARN